jgi:D-alanine--poly(phosphoribitol) ligase subunit 2
MDFFNDSEKTSPTIGGYNTMEKVLDILLKLKPNIDFSKETRLLDDKILDSFDVVMLVSELNQTFNIEIKFGDLTSENLNSVGKINALVDRLAQKEIVS